MVRPIQLVARERRLACAEMLQEFNRAGHVGAGSAVGEEARRPQRADTLTPEVLHGIYKKYFPMDRYTVVTLKPE